MRGRPIDLPLELRSLLTAVHGSLGVGAAGKTGVLELSVAPRAGATRVTREYQRAPLYIYRPVYLDACRPDMAFVYVLQAGDGLVQGDRYHVDVHCDSGSALHLTTQTATNVFAAQNNLAAQVLNLRVAAGAVLEYLPDPVVPFRASRLFQRISVTIDPTATAILGETLLPGRVARGEAHDYDLYWTETEARRPDGELLFADVLRFRPGLGEKLNSLGLLGGNDVVGTLYVISKQIALADLAELIRHELAGHPEVLAGVSELPNSCGVAVRLLGATSKSAKAAQRAAWNAARIALLGVPAPDLRKG
jgi:urease accessory protein